MKDKNCQQKVRKNPKHSDNIWAREVFSNSRQALQSIIGSSPIPAFSIGKDHLIIYWNKALEELSGIKAGEVVGTGQQWRAFYKTARPCMADLLVDKFKKEIPQWYAGKFIKSKLIAGAYEATDFFPELGKRGRWLRFTAAIIRNSKGSVIGAVETLEDITPA
jgi:PAS domain-containing protein